jgi:hypothetical protein
MTFSCSNLVPHSSDCSPQLRECVRTQGLTGAFETRVRFFAVWRLVAQLQHRLWHWGDLSHAWGV